MTRKDELLDTLRRSFDGEAWHGPALADVLADVRAEEALWRPAMHVHSIWEITLHAAGWAAEVASRLKGGEPKEPETGDWPEPDSSAAEDGWQDAIQRVFNNRDVVLAAVRALDAADLDVMSGTSTDPPLGTGFSRAGLIEGLAQHNTYHAGQISLLKKMIRTVV
jgi:uncharacterized damage-inducible protein DinB